VVLTINGSGDGNRHWISPLIGHALHGILLGAMNPTLFQLNTRASLTRLGPHATLDDVPDQHLDTLASRGFDWVWLLGVWSLGEASPSISRSNQTWRVEYLHALKDLRDEDITGSPFAVFDYSVDPRLGGDSALRRFRERLSERGIKLLVDFVPNHVALDHRWVNERPEFFISGTHEDLERDPLRWTATETGQVLAYGRDPNYPGWLDTLQLNYFNPELREAMVQELTQLAESCDGVRCDMAMLLEPEVFQRTWGHVSGYEGLSLPFFWPEAIERVRRLHPDFLFIAEVYWDYEHRLQQHGFDYTYDKTLYDRLLSHNAEGVRAHLRAPLEYLQHMAHFLENHDEPRIASTLNTQEHLAAAILTFSTPGLRLLHDGQLEGKRIRIPVHLRRGPDEALDPAITRLYDALLPIITSAAVTSGAWSLLACHPAWEGNPTTNNFVVYLLEHSSGDLLIAVNFAAYQGQTFIELPQRIVSSSHTTFTDLLSGERYVRERSDLEQRGLFLDVPAWKPHVFRIERS